MTKPGDKVRIITDTDSFEGILMPRPELLAQGITVLKLKNGYNLGIDSQKIKKTELIEEYSSKKSEAKQPEFNKKLPTVSILSTGGTISSKIDYRTGAVYADYTAEDFILMCPELRDIANIKARKIMSMMSEDMNHETWIQIAKETARELNNPDIAGVIITHGTDTLSFTSAALSFLLKDLNKPVIITGSQRSIDRGSSDAFMNLICSVIAAAKFNAAEVMTCLHGTTDDDYCLLIRGTKARKMHTSRRDAFRPINELPIAKVFEDGKIDILNHDYKSRKENEVIAENRWEPKIALLQIYPGIDPEIMDFYISKGYKAIILSATALGHVSTFSKNSFIPYIKKATEKGIPVFITTQSLYGRVNPNVYTPLRKISIEAGAIFLEDMLPETAYIKAGFILGNTKDFSKIKELMLTNIAGEITERSEEKSFLY